MVSKFFGVTLTAALAISVPIAAQNLSMPEGQRAAQAETGQPTRGMTMRQVESSFGSPLRRRAPVGDPPITRWEYDGFIVYFEHKHVIHSVAKR